MSGFWERTLPEAFPERDLSSRNVASKCCSDSFNEEEDLYMSRKSITILLSRYTYFMQARLRSDISQDSVKYYKHIDFPIPVPIREV
jgi:hypothetical protein